MSETIKVTFDPKSLPTWAQKDRAVVVRCKVSLSFRAEIHNAKTAQMKRFLSKEAQRLQSASF
ncbi:MAG: hypothetical protein H0U23_13920 [Blastocatellia bacterium]|nr:hypothetical protein [Blastocatellia bacterium]